MICRFHSGPQTPCRHGSPLSTPSRPYSPALHCILTPYESCHLDPYPKLMAEITDLLWQPPRPRELAALAAGQPPSLWLCDSEWVWRSKADLDLSCPLKTVCCMMDCLACKGVCELMTNKVLTCRTQKSLSFPNSHTCSGSLLHQWQVSWIPFQGQHITLSSL